MKNREDVKYIIKVFEAQWDTQHTESVKPFFEQLKREMLPEDHDALYSYYVFQGPESLLSALTHYQRNADVEGRLKIGYFSAHGEKDKLKAIGDISRVKMRNMLISSNVFDGLFFGACDFTNRKTAELMLNSMPSLKWVAGYSKWMPWLEGTICDILFFKLLLGGKFARPGKNARWIPVNRPEDAAYETYNIYPLALDLKFSLFYRGPTNIISTLENYVTARER
jgi:hypothetical protein